MKDSTRILAFLAWFVIWVLVGFGLGRRSARNTQEPTILRDTVFHTIYEPIEVEKPVTKFVEVIRHDTLLTEYWHLQHDTVFAEVPIERKVYEEDSLYRAVVTGWHASLDSLLIYKTTNEMIITNTVRTPPPKFSFGLTAGPSALVNPLGQTHIGLGATVGLTYRF